MRIAVLSDTAVLPGSAHVDSAAQCQDYALASKLGEPAWAIVSDGCSTGGHSDIGARMWAHAARMVLQERGPSVLADEESCIAHLLAKATPLLAPFDYADGFATLMLAASDGKSARVQVFGDGVVAALRGDDTLQVWDIRYDLNAPRYLNYARDEQSEMQWAEATAGTCFRVVFSEYEPDGYLAQMTPSELDAAGTAGLSLEFEDVSDLQALFVCTDGVSSIPDQSLSEVIRQLVQVKNPVGQYMQRRLGSMVRSWKKTRRPGPSDDLAVGALWFLPMAEE